MWESLIRRQIKEAAPLIFLNTKRFLLTELISAEIGLLRLVNMFSLGYLGISKQVGNQLRHEARLDT